MQVNGCHVTCRGPPWPLTGLHLSPGVGDNTQADLYTQQEEASLITSSVRAAVVGRTIQWPSNWISIKDCQLVTFTGKVRSVRNVLKVRI